MQKTAIQRGHKDSWIKTVMNTTTHPLATGMVAVCVCGGCCVGVSVGGGFADVGGRDSVLLLKGSSWHLDYWFALSPLRQRAAGSLSLSFSLSLTLFLSLSLSLSFSISLSVSIYNARGKTRPASAERYSSLFLCEGRSGVLEPLHRALALLIRCCGSGLAPVSSWNWYILLGASFRWLTTWTTRLISVARLNQAKLSQSAAQTGYDNHKIIQCERKKYTNEQ